MYIHIYREGRVVVEQAHCDPLPHTTIHMFKRSTPARNNIYTYIYMNVFIKSTTAYTELRTGSLRPPAAHNNRCIESVNTCTQQHMHIHIIYINMYVYIYILYIYIYVCIYSQHPRTKNLEQAHCEPLPHTTTYVLVWPTPAGERTLAPHNALKLTVIQVDC